MMQSGLVLCHYDQIQHFTCINVENCERCIRANVDSVMDLGFAML